MPHSQPRFPSNWVAKLQGVKRRAHINDNVRIEEAGEMRLGGNPCGTIQTAGKRTMASSVGSGKGASGKSLDGHLQTVSHVSQRDIRGITCSSTVTRRILVVIVTRAERKRTHRWTRFRSDRSIQASNVVPHPVRRRVVHLGRFRNYGVD